MQCLQAIEKKQVLKSHLKHRERTLSNGSSSFLQSPMSPKSCDIGLVQLSESKSLASLSETDDRPTTSSSSNISDTVSKNFIRKSSDQDSLRYSYPAQSESSMISTSTADETASQISLMRDSINQTISRTKSYEVLKEEDCGTLRSSPIRPRPKSLFCTTSTPIRSHDRIPEDDRACQLGSPEETDPTLKAVKKAMQRSDFLQRLDK